MNKKYTYRGISYSVSWNEASIGGSSYVARVNDVPVTCRMGSLAAAKSNAKDIIRAVLEQFFAALEAEEE